MVFSGRGVDSRLANGLTRLQEGQILKKLNEERPGIACQMQEFGTGENLMCSDMYREGTHLEVLQLRLEGRTRRIGGCG